MRLVACVALGLAVGAFLVRERGLSLEAALLSALGSSALGFFALRTLDRLRRLAVAGPPRTQGESSQQEDVDPRRSHQAAEQQTEPEGDESGREHRRV